MPIVVTGQFKPSDPMGLYRDRQNPLTGAEPSNAYRGQASLEGNPTNSYDTPLTASEEAAFQEWKARYAPDDNGEDYDLRGAFKAGLKPGPDGHWADTYKKPNHSTFSTQSRYAAYDPDNAGTWDEAGNYVPSPNAAQGHTDRGGHPR